VAFAPPYPVAAISFCTLFYWKERRMTDRPQSTTPSTPSPLAPDALKRVRDSFSRQGLVGTLGAWLVELETGRAVIEIPYSNRVAGQSGRFHSAVVAGIAQACGGSAAGTLLPEGTALAAGAISMSFTGATEGELLRAEGKATADGPDRWKVAVEVTCRRGETLVAAAAAGTLTFVVRAKAK
jgi:acyl-coenzyme A thioesterase PaaI-like protein